MSGRDDFSVYLRGLRPEEIAFERAPDVVGARSILRITDDVTLYVRPDRYPEYLADTIAGLQKLAEAATEMAAALSETGGAQ